MRTALKPNNEASRLAALHRYGVLDTVQEQAFDDITALASNICGTPIALITFVDADRLWIKSGIGVGTSETARNIAFCSHAIQVPDQVFVVNDTLDDVRFRDNPLVTGDPSIRFYAGAPIMTADGYALGSVCALDSQPRQLSTMQINSLSALSRLVSGMLEHSRFTQAQAAQAIDTNRQQMENLLTLAMDGIDLKAFIDCNYTYKYLNQTYLDYWNKRADQAEGKSVAEVMGEENFAKIKPLMARALAGENVSYFAHFDYPTKGSRHMQVAYRPARNAEGDIIGAAIRVNDLQDLKDSEERLKASVAMLEERSVAQQRFIHIISHDLREPVNTIVNFASLLASDHAAGLSESGQQFLRYVSNGGERMRELLDDLLNFVRIDHAHLELRTVDLDRVMQGVREDLADAIARSGAVVEWEGLPEISGERSMIRILMQNLVANAVKFARKGVPPAVRISAHASEQWWEICVHDNGIGIPEKKREKIFDLFGRLHSRKDFDGTGLGLATCRKIAELHHGRIRVSAQPDHGSCFHILLPRRSPGVADTVSPEEKI